MNNDPIEFSSDYILDQYRKINEVNWRGDNDPDDLEQLNSLYEPGYDDEEER